LQVRLQDITTPISAASFTIGYPANVLRFRGAQDHRAGSMVPQSAAPVWNVGPGQNDYLNQSGQLRFAVSASSPWPSRDGVLAELTFEVLNPPAGEYSWPVTLYHVEVTPDGYDLKSLQTSAATFTTQPELGSVALGPSGNFTFTFGSSLGANLVVEASTNLLDWVTLTNVVNPSGPVLIADPNAARFPHRFYRTRIAE
jgi:hypothetical protein